MKKNKIVAMKKKLKIGDTVTLSINGKGLVSGIVYIVGSIPMGKFYSKNFGLTYDQNFDTYEEAVVLIDSKKRGSLTVLTLEEGEDRNKMFIWGDLFQKKELDFEEIYDIDKMDIEYESALLTEIPHSFQ